MKEKYSYVAVFAAWTSEVPFGPLPFDLEFRQTVFGAESAEPLSGTAPLVRPTPANSPVPAENAHVRA